MNIMTDSPDVEVPEADSPERAALRVAFNNLKAAKAAVEALKDAAQRTTDKAAQYEAIATELAGVDQEVSAYRVQQSVQGADILTLPDDLAARVMDRKAALDYAQKYREAHADLVDHIVGAEEAVAMAAHEHHNAISAVMSAHADVRARRMAEYEALADAERKWLNAYDCTKVVVPGMPQISSMHLSNFAREALRNGPPRYLKNPEQELMNSCRAIYQALAADPNAPIEGPIATVEGPPSIN